MTEPRDQLVDPQHWADVEAIHQRNLEYCLRRIRDGVEGAEDRYGEVRLYGWLSRYSRGDELDGLVEEVPDRSVIGSRSSRTATCSSSPLRLGPLPILSAATTFS